MAGRGSVTSAQARSVSSRRHDGCQGSGLRTGGFGLGHDKVTTGAIRFLLVELFLGHDRLRLAHGRHELNTESEADVEDDVETEESADRDPVPVRIRVLAVRLENFRSHGVDTAWSGVWLHRHSIKAQ